MELKLERAKGIEEPAIEVLNCKWTILVFSKIAGGLSRPSEIKRAIPKITVKVLNERLRKLEGKGVIKRRSFGGYPLHVEYTLDANGMRLKPIVEEMAESGISADFMAEVISCKWMVGIVRALRRSPMRTNEIKRLIAGISGKVLSERLRKLEEMGFVRREVMTAPLGVRYSFLEMGDRAAAIIEAMVFAERKVGKKMTSLGA